MSIFKSICGSCLGFSGPGASPQGLILGLEGSGKTTFLYRLKLGRAWDVDKMPELKEMRNHTYDANGVLQIDDSGYHYETLGVLKDIGLWDVPGSSSMRECWNCFYKTIKIHVVFFIVDAAETNDSAIATSRKLLHMLLNEDELRLAAFEVIINNKKVRGSKTSYDIKGDDPLHYKLGLHDLHEDQEWRVRKHVINVMEVRGIEDQHMTAVKEHIKQVLEDKRGYGLKF